MENIKCKEKRSLFNLFKVYSCEQCKYNYEDETINIGGNIVNLYYLKHNCFFDILDDYYIANNKNLKVFLKDMIKISNNINQNYINHSNDIVVWIRREDFVRINEMKIIYDLLSFENNLHILVF